MGGNVASLDGANAETINFRNAGFWTGMAASKRQAVGIQEICRVSVQAVIGSVGSGDDKKSLIAHPATSGSLAVILVVRSAIRWLRL